VARRKVTKKLTHEQTPEKKKVILAALVKASASEDILFPKESADALSSESQGYFTLSHDEMAVA
jgi:hypothetical protein